jgi:hypothetical protein
MKMITGIVNPSDTLVPNTLPITPGGIWPATEIDAINSTSYDSYEEYYLHTIISALNEGGAEFPIKGELKQGPINNTPYLDIENNIVVWTDRNKITNPHQSEAKLYGQIYSVLPPNIVLKNSTGRSTGNYAFINWNRGNNQTLDLGSASNNVTVSFNELLFVGSSSSPTVTVGSQSGRPGAHYLIKVIQNATAAYDIIWPANVQNSSTITIDPTLSSVTLVSLFFDGTDYYPISGSGGSQGGSASILLKPNAGLTNSGPTYSTIYNTTVADLTTVTGSFAAYNGQHPFTWMRGMTAGFLKEKSLVEIFNLIFFPTVPFIYTQPTSLISPSLTLYRSVSNVSQSVGLTLTYARGNAGTASGYTFLLNGVGINQQPSTLDSVSHTHTFTSTVPSIFNFTGTVSYIAGNVCLDSSNQPQLPSIPAGIEPPNNTVSTCTIFPWIYGSVSNSINLTTFSGSCVDACKQACCLGISTPGLTVSFNAILGRKSYLAIPQSAGSQNTQQVFNFYCQTNNQGNNSPIPGSLWTYSTYQVNICGVNHTYSVYLFNYESPTDGPFMFCKV